MKRIPLRGEWWNSPKTKNFGGCSQMGRQFRKTDKYYHVPKIWWRTKGGGGKNFEKFWI